MIAFDPTCRSHLGRPILAIRGLLIRTGAPIALARKQLEAARILSTSYCLTSERKMETAKLKDRL